MIENRWRGIRKKRIKGWMLCICILQTKGNLGDIFLLLLLISSHVTHKSKTPTSSLNYYVPNIRKIILIPRQGYYVTISMKTIQNISKYTHRHHPLVNISLKFLKTAKERMQICYVTSRRWNESQARACLKWTTESWLTLLKIYEVKNYGNIDA